MNISEFEQIDHRLEHDDFGGLRRDVAGLVGRRHALLLFGAAGLTGILASCSSSSNANSSSSISAASSSTAATTAGETTTTAAATTGSTASGAGPSAGAEIPDETGGPFPADGTNGPNMLTEAGIERADITTSMGEYSGTAEGVPATFQLTVVDAGTGAAMPGAAIYMWHCTADGKYSTYELEDQNYLRGVLETDDAGRVAFESIFPGCYSGRWPHCHFEVYSTIGEATSGREAIKTSQLALAEADCIAVYTDSRYGNSQANLDRLSLDSDNVFRDGWTDQLATAAGDLNGYTVSLLIRV